VGQEQDLCKAPLPPHTPGTNDPVCLGLILRPVTPPPFLCTLHMFILGEVAVGYSHRHVWLAVQDLLGPLWISWLWQVFLLCPEAGILCTGVPVCFPSSPCQGGVRV
jgi:hypothetical protein